MKILLDTIPTNDPAHCASTVKFKKIVQYVLEHRNDVWFYWLVPDWATEEDLKFYPNTGNDQPGFKLNKGEQRITYIPYPYSKDRMREYVRMQKGLEDLIAFYGKYWDVDVVVTNRTPFVPAMKTMMNKTAANLIWSKKVFLIEDMPLMDFKKHVALQNPRAQEIASLAGYLTADKTAISAFWEKKLIMQDAEKYLSHSAISYIDKNMIETTAVHVDQPGLKTKASIQRMLDGKRPFTAAFIGRMTHNSRAEDIFDLIGKHWIMKGEKKFRGFISTQSKAKEGANRVGRVKIPQWMELHSLPREGFWELVKNEIDCFVFLSPEEDYSMSLMEPLLLGCPAILVKCRWSIPTVGPDYPFFVEDTTQAHGFIKAFFENYPANYKKFAEWQQGPFAKLMIDRNQVYLPKVFNAWLDQWYKDFHLWIKGDMPKAPNNEVVQLIAKWAETKGALDTGRFSILGAIEALGKEGKFRSLEQKLHEDFKDRVKMVWQTDWNYYRLALAALGYKDAGLEPGVIRKE